jgi:hypothetical protein
MHKSTVYRTTGSRSCSGGAVLLIAAYRCLGVAHHSLPSPLVLAFLA